MITEYKYIRPLIYVRRVTSRDFDALHPEWIGLDWIGIGIGIRSSCFVLFGFTRHRTGRMLSPAVLSLVEEFFTIARSFFLWLRTCAGPA